MATVGFLFLLSIVGMIFERSSIGNNPEFKNSKLNWSDPSYEPLSA
jgi:hypothetical protein